MYIWKMTYNFQLSYNYKTRICMPDANTGRVNMEF